MIWILDLIHIGLQIEGLKLVPWLLREELDLATIKAKPDECLGIGQHLVGVEFATDHSQVVIVVGKRRSFGIGIWNHRDIEVFGILEKPFISRISDVVCAKVGV